MSDEPRIRPSRSRDDLLEDDPLKQYFVWWDDITGQDIDQFRDLLDVAQREEEVQTYLRRHPLMLIQHLGGGHGRWVIPKQQLGSEYVTDFMIGDRDSTGRRWIAVELESPTRKMFTQAGDPTRELTHAIRQILDWRTWLTKNQNYAARSREEDGLGLEDIDSSTPGLIVIGRRRDTSPATGARRRELMKSGNVEIHTFDWLIERAEGRVVELHDSKARSWKAPSPD